MVARASGAAQRRRLRRLRAALRHEQRSIAMALASALHHSADKTTRAQHNAPRGQKNAGPEYCELSMKTWCLRGVPGHPVWVSRGGHRIGISCVPWSRLPIMPLWYRFWMHLWRRWWNSCRTSRGSSTFSGLIPSRLLKWPKILPHDVHSRRLSHDTQLAEQLVEVPTIMSYSSLQLITEQNVDTPVPRGGGRNAGLQGFLPGQGSTTLPSSLERISEQTLEQIVDIPGGGLQDFRPGQSLSSSSHFPAVFLFDADEPGEGFFRTSPQNKKKCETGSALESESARQCQLIHASSSSPYSSLGVGHDPRGSGALLLGPPHRGDTLDDGGRVLAFLVFAAWWPLCASWEW